VGDVKIEWGFCYGQHEKERYLTLFSFRIRTQALMPFLGYFSYYDPLPLTIPPRGFGGSQRLSN